MKKIALIFSVFFLSGCTSASDFVSSIDEKFDSLFSAGADDEIAVVYPAEQSAEDQASIERYYGPGWKNLSRDYQGSNQ